MPTIAESCEKIIEKRKNERLPIISEKLKKLQELKDALTQLQKYQNRVKENRDPFIFALSDKAPQVFETIRDIDLNELLGENGKIEKLEKELKRLEKRFGRDGVQIALMGHARQGKSLFLQSVSELPDDVIPTSSHTDCTGALSVIENVEGAPFEITIEYYDEESFVKFFNKSLEQTGLRYTVYSLQDIRSLEPILKRELESGDIRIIHFFNEYYSKGLGYLDSIGKEPLTIKENQSVVTELVAKHKAFDSNDIILNDFRDKNYVIEYKEDNQKYYVYFNQYIAVKKTHIKCDFDLEDARHIILLDTVGLGNKFTEEKDKATLFQTLKEDTDAAIYIFKVKPGGQSGADTSITNEIDEIFDELKGLNPELWIAINENCLDESYFNGNNDQYKDYKTLCSTVYKDMTNCRYGKDKDNQVKPIHFGMVNNKDRKAVINEIMIPVLTGIADNVSKLDEIFMKNADAMATDIYYSYESICKRIYGSLDALQKNSPTYEITLRNNYERLPLSNKLREYSGILREHRDSVLPKIIDELLPQIEDITLFVPEKMEIENEFHGMVLHVTEVYNKICDKVTADIIKKLHEVSSKTILDIETELKIKIAQILYEDGLLSKLSVSTGKLNGDSDAIKWLESICNEKLYKYPDLERAVKDVLNFHMKIEGFIFAKCIKASEILETNPNKYANDNDPLDVRVDFVWNNIKHKVVKMRAELKNSLGLADNNPNDIWGFGQEPVAPELAKPSLLLWCAADSFNKVFLFADNGNQLKDFYREYAFTIWHDDFQQQVDFDDATKEVYQLVENLKSKNLN